MHMHMPEWLHVSLSVTHVSDSSNKKSLSFHKQTFSNVLTFVPQRYENEEM